MVNKESYGKQGKVWQTREGMVFQPIRTADRNRVHIFENLLDKRKKQKSYTAIVLRYY
jgi:hypothetical protein